MEEDSDNDDTQVFDADFDDIDCPSWIDFDEENYEPRDDDVRWFASLQPHLRTPESIIKAEKLEKLESDKNAPICDISSTPNVKQRQRCKANPSKTLSNKLQFSSSDGDDDEIFEMLKAHNKRIQHQSVKLPKSQPSSDVINQPVINQPVSKVVLNVEKNASSKPVSKVVLNVEKNNSSKPVSSMASKRRSCAPLLMKNKTSRCTKGLPFSNTSEPYKVNSVQPLLSSTFSPKSDNLNTVKVSDSSQKSSDNILKTKTVSSDKVSKPAQTRPGVVSSKQPVLQKNLNPGSSKTRVGQKSNSIANNLVKTKPAPELNTNKLSSQSSSAKPVKALPTTKPVIKSTVSKRPQSSTSSGNKVLSSSTLSKTQTSKAKVSIPNKAVPCKKNLVKTKPHSQTQSRPGDPFGASSNVLSIINSKTPGKGRIRSKPSEGKPRYSVETPSPPRTANCESSDDEDLDAFIRSKLKAHNAKVEAKMIASNRIPGKTIKTGKKVSLHLGSPSRPKMKPVRHKE